jgi:hypothetical protein
MEDSGNVSWSLTPVLLAITLHWAPELSFSEDEKMRGI